MPQPSADWTGLSEPFHFLTELTKDQPRLTSAWQLHDWHLVSDSARPTDQAHADSLLVSSRGRNSGQINSSCKVGLVSLDQNTTVTTPWDY